MLLLLLLLLQLSLNLPNFKIKTLLKTSYPISIPNAPNAEWKIPTQNHALNLNMTKYKISALVLFFPISLYLLKTFIFFPNYSDLKPLKQFNPSHIQLPITSFSFSSVSISDTSIVPGMYK